MTIANQLARRLCTWLAMLGLMLSLCNAQAQTVIYYHTDALGSPIATTNATGAKIDLTEYEPYGQVLNEPIADGPGYTGHVSDARTGLSYMQQRYYDPQIGRFLSTDPVAADPSAGGNFNRYWYAGNNPYKFTDPDGRYWCSGGPDFCGKVDRFVATLRRALGAMEPSSSHFKRLSEISAALGEPWQENGITFNPQKLDSPANNGPTPGAINMDMKLVQGVAAEHESVNAGMSAEEVLNAYGADVVAHEISHDLDRWRSGQKNWFPKTEAAEFTTETKAYRIQSHVDRVQKFTTGLNWPGMKPAERESAIKSAAQSSTNSWCEKSGRCE